MQDAAGPPRRIPVAIRATALAGVALTAGYAAAYLATRNVDPAAAGRMLRMYVVTLLAGRETAMLDALNAGMPPISVFVLSVVDDVGAFLLALPAMWWLTRFLRRSSRVRWGLAHLEKQALVHRRWVQNWGLGGLALVYFLPGLGTGVPATALLGTLARIPLTRLVIFFSVATVVVDAAWTVLLAGALRLLPDSPLIQAVPLVVVTLLVASAGVGAWRGRHERHVALLDWPVSPTPQDAERMLQAGIQPTGRMIRADLDAFAERLGGPKAPLGQRLQAAELMLLDGVEPWEAMALVKASVTGIEDVAGLGQQTLANRAAAANVAWAQRGLEWVEQARRMVNAQHAGWRKST